MKLLLFITAIWLCSCSKPETLPPSKKEVIIFRVVGLDTLVRKQVILYCSGAPMIDTVIIGNFYRTVEVTQDIVQFTLIAKSEKPVCLTLSASSGTKKVLNDALCEQTYFKLSETFEFE